MSKSSGDPHTTCGCPHGFPCGQVEDDDCGPEIADLYSTDRLRELVHRFALTRPDFDELSTRMIAVIQLCEAQQRTLRSLSIDTAKASKP